MPLHGEAQRATYVGHRPVVAQQDRLVVLAHHQVFGGPCVQKTVMFSEQDGSIWSEANLLARLRHPRLVEVREAQSDPEFPQFVTFVMPHYPGGSVVDALQVGHRFSIHRAIQVTLDLLEGLAFLHNEFRLVHRDVKGGNLLLSEDRGRGFLSDLGSASLANDDGEVPLANFTLAYLDPHTRLTDSMGFQSDVYSAGYRYTKC